MQHHALPGRHQHARTCLEWHGVNTEEATRGQPAESYTPLVLTTAVCRGDGLTLPGAGLLPERGWGCSSGCLPVIRAGSSAHRGGLCIPALLGQI